MRELGGLGALEVPADLVDAGELGRGTARAQVRIWLPPGAGWEVGRDRGELEVGELGRGGDRGELEVLGLVDGWRRRGARRHVGGHQGSQC